MITEWSAHGMAQRLDDLAEILQACVTDGASVGFILPHTRAEAKTFWQGLLAEVEGGARRLYVALEQGQPAGVVTLITAMPGNQPHRGEISKLLVHPGHRRKGLARQLMQHLEAEARRLGKGLLTLDTRTGDAAEPLYSALGFQTAGVIPGYCLDVHAERYDSTTYMFKRLD